MLAIVVSMLARLSTHTARTAGVRAFSVGAWAFGAAERSALRPLEPVLQRFGHAFARLIPYSSLGSNWKHEYVIF